MKYRNVQTEFYENLVLAFIINRRFQFIRLFSFRFGIPPRRLKTSNVNKNNDNYISFSERIKMHGDPVVSTREYCFFSKLPPREILRKYAAGCDSISISVCTSVPAA